MQKRGEEPKRRLHRGRIRVEALLFVRTRRVSGIWERKRKGRVYPGLEGKNWGGDRKLMVPLHFYEKFCDLSFLACSTDENSENGIMGSEGSAK